MLTDKKKGNSRRPHRDALDKLNDRVDEVLDLYRRMALHVGFVDEPIQTTEPSEESQRKNMVFRLTLGDIRALKDRAYAETKKAGRRITQQSLVDAALKAYLYK